MPNCWIPRCGVISSCAIKKEQRELEKFGKIGYHVLPTNLRHRKVWLDNLNIHIDDGRTINRWICSLHFNPSDIDRTSVSCVRLRDGAVSYVHNEYITLAEWLQRIEESKGVLAEINHEPADFINIMSQNVVGRSQWSHNTNERTIVMEQCNNDGKENACLQKCIKQEHSKPAICSSERELHAPNVPHHVKINQEINETKQRQIFNTNIETPKRRNVRMLQLRTPEKTNITPRKKSLQASLRQMTLRYHMAQNKIRTLNRKCSKFQKKIAEMHKLEKLLLELKEKKCVRTEEINVLKGFIDSQLSSIEGAIQMHPYHMLKLVRNCFGELKNLLNGNNELISWKFIEQLHEIQEKEELHLGNKLTNKHVNFGKQKMKVKLAAQIFSKSVANALYFCSRTLPNMKDCGPTIEFLKYFDDLFDILNSKNMKDIAFKKEVNKENKDAIFKRLDECASYISLIKNSAGENILNTSRATGFLGFLISINSLKSLCTELCENKNLLQFIPTYKFSQDHIELLFGCIRAHNGSNNNPTCAQFKAAFKKILIHTELRPPSSGNCIPLENVPILHISSTVNRKQAELVNAEVDNLFDILDITVY